MGRFVFKGWSKIFSKRAGYKRRYKHLQRPKYQTGSDGGLHKSIPCWKDVKREEYTFRRSCGGLWGADHHWPYPEDYEPDIAFRTQITKRAIDWKDFHPLESVYNFLETLEVEYPSTCTVISIGKSVEGRDIKMLKISNSDATNTGVWLDGAIHAREWITTSVVTYIADQLAKNFTSLGDAVTNKDWYLVPIVNPDGYHHSFTGDRMWRKSRARNGNVITGVDLNRNFGNNWGKNGNEMSSSDPHHQNYRGPAPFSEPESTALKDIILYSGTPFKIFLTFHAYSEVISFPWCYSSDPCLDYVSLLEGGTCMAKAIYETTGRMYKVGNFKDIMYYACGTSLDWSYGTARIPFSYLVELRSKQDKFLLPKDQIRACCKEIFNGTLALVEFVDGKKCLNCTIFGNKIMKDK